MPPNLPLSSSPTSRRSFLRLAGLAASAPILGEGHLAWAALRQPPTQPAAEPHSHRSFFPVAPAPGAVMINANENPLGPCQAALGAIATAAATGGRYDANDSQDRLVDLVSQQTGLPTDHIAVYAGSTEPLHFSVLAFTSSTRPYVTADPGYEAGMYAAAATGAPVLKTALTPAYAHDVRAMVAASPSAGLLYICNPNNPTGTVTSREDLLWALANKPKGSVLLVDEAYIHFSHERSMLDQVALGKDLIVLRTFSKIYGMAGIRCGLALGRPDLLQQIDRNGDNFLPVTALAAAIASLDQPTLVETRREIVTSTRNETFAWLTAKGYKFTPSVSNCFTIDTGRPGKQVIAAMQRQNVYIGRAWPVWPTCVRITVGTPQEMATFRSAFEQVMAQPAQA